MTDFKYKFTKTIFVLIGSIPLPILYWLSPIIYFVLYRVISYRRSVVNSNLKLVFPEKTDKEIKTIRLKFYWHLSQLFIEVVAGAGISQKKLDKRMKFRNTEMIEQLHKEGRNVVLVGSHYANWEWNLIYPLYTKFTTLMVYKKADNQLFNRVLIDIRSRFGVVLVEMKNTVRTTLTYAKKEPTLLYLIADQTPAEAIHYMDFLGVSGTPVFMGPEKIAKSLNAAFIYTKFTKVKRGNYILEFVLLEKDSKNTKEGELTRKYMDALEVDIKNQPEYWLWSHRRWKRRKLD